MVKTTERRCPWCTDDPLYIAYHDLEWGIPTTSEQALFELLVLEGMQSGLSWLTVLRKRAHMREQFFRFDPARLADADAADLHGWLDDPGVIRHRGKLESMVDNARACLSLPQGLASLVWSFVDGAPRQNRWRRAGEVPAQTATSVAMAKALKEAGFSFVGPKTCYAFMQSAGLINDHLLDCAAYDRCARTPVA